MNLKDKAREVADDMLRDKAFINALLPIIELHVYLALCEAHDLNGFAEEVGCKMEETDGCDESKL